MCDALSLLSAGTSLLGADVAAFDAKSRGDFEAQMLEANSVLAAAQTRREEVQLRREFNEANSKNVAAIAMSGLDAKSFESVAKGNAEDLQDNIALMQAALRTQQADMAGKASLARVTGRLEAKAAMWSGLTQAGTTLFRANEAFRDNRNPNESRMAYFKRSFS